jgi:RNA polymerase sigma factor (sigma-70 family)
MLGHNRDEALVAGVRRRDRRAFEAIYERHAAQLLTFCIYLLGSRHDAEDALQATFASAYRALLNDSRPVSLRPWLFTIARNESLSILRKRRPQVELNGEVALTGDPVKLAEVHEEMVNMIGGIRELPEKQRAALVLAEVHGMSHAEIGSVLDVRPDQVKAYVFQARSNLLSDRHAREADCREIREELATEHGRVRTRARLRRHLRSCDGCRAYANGVERQHRQLASLLPILPAVTLRYRAIDQALGLCGSDVANYANSATMAGTALEVAGGGMTALAAKVATGIVAVGASAGVGMTVIDTPTSSRTRPPAEVRSVGSSAQLASTSTRARGSRTGYDGQVEVAVKAGSLGSGSGALHRERLAGGRERAGREAPGEFAISLGGERTSGSGKGNGAGSGAAADAQGGGSSPLQERRQATDQRREQRAEALEERRDERKEAHQPAPVLAEGPSTSPVKHTHGGGGTEGSPGESSGEKKSGGKSGGKSEGKSGESGSKGAGGGKEREHVRAQGPNKNKQRWEERHAERKKRRAELLAERKRRREERLAETPEQAP